MKIPPKNNSQGRLNSEESRPNPGASPVNRLTSLIQRIPPLGRWLELSFLNCMLLVAFVIHYQTLTSISAKDFYAIWHAFFLTLLGGLLFILRKEHRNVPLYFMLPLAGYLIFGTIRTSYSEFFTQSWESWRFVLVSMSPILPAYLISTNLRAYNRLFRVFSYIVASVCIYALFQFTASNLQVFFGFGRKIDPVYWPWNDAPILGSLMKFLEIDLKYFKWQDFPGFFWMRRACSTFGNPTFLSGFLVLALPIFVTHGVYRLKIGRSPRLSWVCAVLTLLGMASTLSKGCALGVAGSIVVFLLLVCFSDESLASKKTKKYLRFSIAALVLLAVVSLSVAFIKAGDINDKTYDPLKSVQVRSLTYTTLFRMIGDEWLWGFGAGVFPSYFSDYMEENNAEIWGWAETPETKLLEHAHCEFLEVWLNQGIFGFALILLVWAGWFHWTWKGWRSLGQDPRSWILAGLISGVGGMLIENSTSVSMRWMPSAWMFWTMVGAALGLTSSFIGKSRPTVASDLSPRATLTALTVACMISATLFIPHAGRFCSDWMIGYVRSSLTKSDPRIDKVFQRAIELNPASTEAIYLYAGHLFQKGDYRESLKYFQKVREARGDIVVLSENIATIYFRLSHEAETEAERTQSLWMAIEEFEKNLAKHPTYARLDDYLARCYQRAGLERMAQVHRQQAIALYVKWFKWGRHYERADYALDLGKNYFIEKKYDNAYYWYLNVFRWHGDPKILETALETLFKIDPAYKEKWEADTKSVSNESINQIIN